MTDAEPKLVWTVRLNVRWSDLDANGHVNNAVFFTYAEQARIEWMESIASQTTADDYGLVVKKTSCTYLRPITHPARLDVRLLIGAPGRTSFMTYSEIWIAGAIPEKAAEGDAVMVWVNRASGKPHPLPDFLLRLAPV